MLHTRKKQSEETQEQMMARNARRLEIIKRALGVKYAHHPVHHVQRRPVQEWRDTLAAQAESFAL